MASFEELGLKDWLVQSCESMGMRTPTPVQQSCIAPTLQGKDVMGGAPTGSGKTAAFVLPILHKLSDDPFGVFAMVLVPTRELAFQTAEQFSALGSGINLRHCVVVGGLDMMHQARQLQHRPHVVIGTPGRVLDHLRSNDTLKLHRLKFLVLDEADRLLDLGFADDLAQILSHVPQTRQTLLYSATMTHSLDKLRALSLTDPHVFDGCPKHTTVPSLVQHYLFVPLGVKDCYLVHLLATTFQDSTCIVFANTCRQCQLLFHLLHHLDISCCALNSTQTMNRRIAALNQFRAGKSRVLICTDVASRGIDIPEVDVVVNYDIPAVPTDYVQRVGRTARAGRRGQAVSIVTQYDIELFLAIEESIGKKIEELQTDEDEVMAGLKAVATAKRVAKLMLHETKFEERVAEKKGRKHKRKEQGGNGDQGGASEGQPGRKKAKKQNKP